MEKTRNRKIDDSQSLKFNEIRNEKTNASQEKELEKQFDGWRNLLVIIFILTILKSIFQGFDRYGLLVELPISYSDSMEIFWGLAILFFRMIFCLCIYAFAKNLKIENLSLKIIGIFLIIFGEIFNSLFVFKHMNLPYSSAIVYTLSYLNDMKLFSYLIEVENVDFKNFFEFLFLPVLVYKGIYDRRSKRSFRIIFKKLITAFILFHILVFVIDQYAVTAFYNLYRSNSIWETLDSLVNVVMSVLSLFIILFYIVFVCILESLSEFFFLDEKLYEEWWNSESTSEFWAMWNLPVHKFMKIYVFKPFLHKLLKVKERKNNETNYERSIQVKIFFAKFAVFILSGILHELVLSLALKQFSGYFLLAFFLQVPYSFFSNLVRYVLMYFAPLISGIFPTFMDSRNLANFSFWLSFSVIGQPFMVLLFYRSIYLMREFPK